MEREVVETSRGLEMDLCQFVGKTIDRRSPVRRHWVDCHAGKPIEQLRDWPAVPRAVADALVEPHDGVPTPVEREVPRRTEDAVVGDRVALDWKEPQDPDL